ncbi:hypothetical protein MUU75_17700 [Pseudoxanthomonas mexicana]|uniref:hypothetical protein n=1 Tax=Pseudoxanthomonas mexicana TaxID=128785 RepID=UPI001FD6EF26|nr:hypothetical protein [Pseudoxanthomonas mexicana]UOV04887.1 hypothetical protein MUU75_17700 [Pseudoxanthomonas mexicana]
MAKKESIDIQILNWLKDNGYPFEMRIARSLKNSDIHVTQSHYYEDFESATSREIDIIGRIYGFKEPKNYVAIAELETFMTVECKSSPKPWVVFCETKPNPWSIRHALCNSHGEELIRKSGKTVSQTRIYKGSRSAGHGLAQAFSGNVDSPYAAVMAALKAAESQARQARKDDERVAIEHPDICGCSVTIPVVAITAPLYECRLDGDGNPKLTEVAYSSLAFRYPGGEPRTKEATLVHVVTEAGFSAFTEFVVEFHNALMARLDTLIPAET